MVFCHNDAEPVVEPYAHIIGFVIHGKTLPCAPLFRESVQKNPRKCFFYKNSKYYLPNLANANYRVWHNSLNAMRMRETWQK